jgi:23S rRNA pseudouridine2605 synthase
VGCSRRRLDKASEGLLLLTNDSEWGARIAAPETHLDKTYHVQVGIVADEEFLRALVRGVRGKDGECCARSRLRLLRAGEKNCWLEIVLDEGKNRQIRRMMESAGRRGAAVGARGHWAVAVGRSGEGRIPSPHR